MILARASKYLVAVSMGLSGAAAQADVMEIDADGARWVAGGLSAPALGTTVGEPALVDMNAAYVPEEIVADPARHAAGVPAAYMPKIMELAQRYDLSPSLLEAVVWQESRWRANAVSPAGARGLAQLMPGTAREMGVNPDDPMSNLEGGARYLRAQLDRFDGDLEKALAAYNAGPGRVIKAGGVPNIRETRVYVASIMGRLSNHSRADRR